MSINRHKAQDISRKLYLNEINSSPNYLINELHVPSYVEFYMTMIDYISNMSTNKTTTIALATNLLPYSNYRRVCIEFKPYRILLITCDINFANEKKYILNNLNYIHNLNLTYVLISIYINNYLNLHRSIKYGDTSIII